MNKLFTRIMASIAGFAMAIGVGVGVGNRATETNAASSDLVSTSIAFKSNDSDGTTALSSLAADNLVASNDLIENATTMTKIYTGKNGAKFGTGSASGTLVLSLKATCNTNIKTIKFVTAKYGSDTGTFTFKADSTNLKTGQTPGTDYTHTFNSPSTVESLSVSTSSKRGYLKSITVTYEASTVAKHTLTYVSGSNGVYDGSTTKSFEVEEDAKHLVKAPEAVGISPSEGYIFTNWSDGNSTYESGSEYVMGTSDVTLTAQWVAGIALSYNGNGATSGSVATTYVISGGTQIVADNGFTAPSGKQFKEWNTLSTGLGTPYNPGDEITDFASSLELFAIWEDSTSVTFDATSDTGSGSIVKSDITMTSSNGILDNRTEYRFYKNSTLTFERSSGKIGSIEFTGVSGNPISNFTLTSGGGSLSTNGNNGTWEGAATSVTFTASVAQARATKIVVNYYTSADVTLNKSSLTLIVGGSGSTIAVSETSGITNPTYEWERTSGDDCVTLTNTTTDTVTVDPKGTSFAACVLKLTVDGDNLQTPIEREVEVAVVRTSDFDHPFSIVEAKKAIDLNNSTYLEEAHVSGIVSQVDSFNENYKSITYWISDDGTTTNQLQVYSGKKANGADFASVDDVEIGASAIVKGTLKKHNSTYEFDYNNELVQYTAPTRVLSSIELSGAYPTEFLTGDAFSHEGMVVTAHYDNGSTRDVSSEATFSGYNMSTAGEQQVTVSYEENEVVKTATYNITVTHVERINYVLYQQSILTEGDYLITYDDGAMNTTINSDRAQYASINPQNNSVLVNSSDLGIIWHIEKSGDYYTIYNAEANEFLASTGAKNKAQMIADGTDDKALWTIQYSEGTYEIINKQNTTNKVNANLRKNGTYGFACYSTDTGGALTLYKRDLKSYSYLETANSVETLYAKETAGGGQIEEGSVAMRFGITMPKASWDAINECYPITDYGVMCLKRTTLNSYEGSNTIEQAFRNPNQAVTNFNRGNGDTPYEDGDNYRFYVRIGNISEANYDTSIVVAPYILADGQYYFFTEMEESVRSLATKYYNDNTLQIALSNAALRNLAGISE